MLSDFGVAKILEMEETAELTDTGVGVGTPEYMSPEQTLGKPVDGRTDCYALGIVLYEMITGRKPFQADTPLAIAIKQSTEPLPNPRIFVPLLPEKVEHVLIKALAKNPDHRYQSLELFEKALRELALGDLPQPKKPYTPKTKPSMGRKLGWAGGIAAIGLITTFLLLSNLNQDKATDLPLNSTNPVSGVTLPPPLPTITKTIPLPTNTTTITPISTLPPTPTIGIGSVQISQRDGMELVFVPAGKFWMGSDDGIGDPDESPRHEIFLDAYWIDKTEVTNAMYRNCVAAGYCSEPREISSNTREDYYKNTFFSDFPVVRGNPNQYCAWAGRRLPTEAEWEKAAKGEGDSMYPWGNTYPDASMANFDFNKYDTVKVGSYPSGASMYGALDMSGNVWEIVSDYYNGEFYSKSPPTNPQGPVIYTAEIVIRGGSYQSDSKIIRNSERTRIPRGGGANDIGFRCATSVIVIPPSKTPLATNPTPIPGVGQTKVSQKDGMTMMYVPAGEFLMGSIDERSYYESVVENNNYWFGQSDDVTDEYPQHMVKLSAYWIDQTEVTNSMFKLFVSETNYITDAEKDGRSGVFEYIKIVSSSEGVNWKKPLGPTSGLGGLSNHPVVHVSWNDANAYCKWAGKRLPTEAEWEKAARGINGQVYPWGNNYPSISLANYGGNVIQPMGIQTAPSGSYTEGASPFGVLDMAGNIREWVNDYFDYSYYSTSPYENPEGPNKGVNIVRGGSWSDSAVFLRSASRVQLDGTNASTGFRCAMDAD
jgi:formylglycine-generating enzyme required for sulfatase activity